MPYPLPRSLSPSKVSAFKDCPLAFRFSAIDRVPEVPSPATVKGTLVHRALERLFWNHARGERSAEVAAAELEAAWEDLADDPEVLSLELDRASTPGVRRRRRTSGVGVLPPRGPRRRRRRGRRAHARGRRWRPSAARHHRPPRPHARGRARGGGLQDRARPVTEPGAAAPRRGAVLRPAVRAGPGPSAGLRPRSSTSKSPSSSRPRLPTRRSGGRANAPRRCGRRSSGRASPRTSVPRRRRCATGAASVPCARSTAVTRPWPRRWVAPPRWPRRWPRRWPPPVDHRRASSPADGAVDRRRGRIGARARHGHRRRGPPPVGGAVLLRPE